MSIRYRVSNWSILTILFLSGIVLGSLLMSPAGPVVGSLPAQAASDSGDMAIVQPVQSSYAEVVKRALPAVVYISSSRLSAEPTGGFPDNPLFRQFFGNQFPGGFQQPQPRREEGLGSGVVIDSAGYVLTNHHVVEGADQIRVFLADGQQVEASVVGMDSKTDLALLKIDRTELPELALAGNSEPEVGDIVFAIGNPFGVGQTVTMGIVSATGRGNLGIEDYEDFIQTDAAINPGNSGGALIDASGRLVGINTAIIGRSGGNDGIGFAIPAPMAERVVSQLKNHGHVSRGLLGAVVQNVTPDLAKAFGMSDMKGALLGDISDGGPAEKAGLKRGDVVIAINGEPVPDSRRLRLRIAELAPETEVDVTILRDGTERVVPVVLGELTDDGGAGSDVSTTPENKSRGLAIRELTPEIRESLDLPSSTQGVVIDSVTAGSLAASAGLRRGDVIEQVDRMPVTDVAAFAKAFERSKDEAVLLLVNRGGNTFFTVLSAK
ncbi:MAG: DegQ family serine endoprotease [Acidobacteriota bacterium]|nr:MAG: DegQ family serine endoprotease [Acidobacteriota bacterium]